ncbi:MAG: hypothetical protein JSU67_09275 [Gammaproteobacteria bacterium]|nr:MAG: hypothetical protein EP300_09010 [Gammaproteobacteria bacterium]UCH41833.1 MAG: hypothetical protein JSU67_09275 [Gammaproteobacteria bacterium]
MRRGERPLLQLPVPLLLAFVLAFACQLLIHHREQQQLATEYRPLANPLAVDSYRGMAMGSEQLLGYLLAIRLQLHDNQIGRHFSYSLIDYRVLVDWLDRITEISQGTEYPMLLASRIYSSTEDRERLRRMLGFIERRFEDDPHKHWRRLAEACLLAKHRLGDLELALSYAERLALQPASVRMPQWARDFRFLLLAELNELEAAIAIIQAMMQTDVINDPDEKKFLQEKLSTFQQKLFESQQKQAD